jgi:hypothetical protein
MPGSSGRVRYDPTRGPAPPIAVIPFLTPSVTPGRIDPPLDRVVPHHQCWRAPSTTRTGGQAQREGFFGMEELLLNWGAGGTDRQLSKALCPLHVGGGSPHFQNCNSR